MGSYLIRAAAPASEGVASVPGWVSVLPPLVATMTVLATRQVLPALFLGGWVGAPVRGSAAQPAAGDPQAS